MNENINEKIIKPYGDTLNDGIVQISFTLPIEHGARAKKAAKVYLEKLNLEEVQIVHSNKLEDNFTYFIAYAKAVPDLDYSTIKVVERDTGGEAELNFYQINDLIKSRLNRHLIIVGATIGSDAHTVGIDAIINMKGLDGNYGLERYPEIDAFNMGAQVPAEKLLQKALEVNADAILVSQTVTQKDVHIRNFTEFIELMEAENLRAGYLVVAGGPRITNELALELGYDAGFGPGTTPSHVASYIISKIIENKE